MSILDYNCYVLIKINQSYKISEITLSPDRTSSPDILLLERRSPVGAESEDEDKSPKEESKDNMNETNDIAWEGWGDQDVLDEAGTDSNVDYIKTVMEAQLSIKDISPAGKPKPGTASTTLDLNSLDIKVSGQKRSTYNSEDNFFADMEPSIPTSLCLLDILEGNDQNKQEITTKLDVLDESIPSKPIETKFAVADNDPDAGSDGWGDDGWGEDF